jgi:hypothetical protein
VIKIRERVIISERSAADDLQTRVRSASRSANGNQLTLARERQAKQSCAFLWSPAFVPGLALAAGILRDLLTATCLSRLAYYDLTDDHRIDKGRTDDNWIDDDRIDDDWIDDDRINNDRIDELSDRQGSRRQRTPLRRRSRRAVAQHCRR